MSRGLTVKNLGYIISCTLSESSAFSIFLPFSEYTRFFLTC